LKLENGFLAPKDVKTRPFNGFLAPKDGFSAPKSGQKRLSKTQKPRNPRKKPQKPYFPPIPRPPKNTLKIFITPASAKIYVFLQAP
jgi:hypothetical protein